MAEYINKEAVLKAFKLIAKNPNKDYQRGMQDTIDCLVPEVIANMPAADVQPVKHGKWSKQGLKRDGFGGFTVGFICSACKEFVPVKGNYCSNCGARMDGGADDENDR